MSWKTMETAVGKNDVTNAISDESTVTLSPFSEIRKPTMGETYQYFRNLIEGKSIKNLDECISSNTELPLFDESLRLLLIESLHSENEVLKILMSQNENQIKAALRWKWFFQNLPAEFCTKEIFPCVSVSLRCKIINRLSRYLESEEEAEKYFAYIRENYDNARADFILPRCRPEFILEHVEKTKFTFDSNSELRILLNICKRYPETGISVLSVIFDAKGKSYYNFSKYKPVMCYLAGHYPDLMVPFIKKYNSFIPSNTFGIKLTKKLGPKLREDLFPDMIKHLIFKENTLFSMLAFEERVKFIASIVRAYSEELTSRNWCESDHRLACLLKLVPRNDRQAVVESAFKEVYNLNFDEHPKFWTSKILESFPTQTRVPYAEKLCSLQQAEGGMGALQESDDYSSFPLDAPERYLYLHESGVAFERLREILRKTPAVHRREAILCQLVKSCWINDDLQTLQEVVEYVAARHRNDDSTVVFRFLEAICDHFPTSAVNAAIHDKLDDLAYFSCLKDQRNEYAYNRWKERLLHHRLENGAELAEQAKGFFESALLRSACRYTFVVRFEAQHVRGLILALCEEAVAWMRNNTSVESRKETGESLLLGLLATCREYNRLNGRRRISLAEIPGLEGILREKTRAAYGEVETGDWPMDVWERYYGEVMDSYDRAKCLYYVYKRRTDLIGDHLGGILTILFGNYYRSSKSFLTYLTKAASFLGKTDEAKGIILSEFKNERSKNRTVALELYSHMCTLEEFGNAIERYVPKQEKVERRSEGDFDQVQIQVPRLIRNVKPRWRNLGLILKFSLGDFLKRVLPSLYACCFHTRCDVVVPFLRKRLDEVPPKVSHVKDIIRLVLELSDREGRREFCLYCWNKYTHYTARSIVLRHVLRFFTEERTRESFRVLEKCISDCDETSIDVLPELGKIPEEFLNDYVTALWRFSEGQKPNFRVNFRRNLVQGFSEGNIDLLSPEFSETVIRENLFEGSSKIPVEEFAAAYLSAKPDAVETRTGMVLDLIKERKPDPRLVYGFFNILIGKSAKRPADFADVFAVVLDNWPEYPLGVLYEERLLFTYHNLYQRVVKRCGDSDETPVEFGKELGKLLAGVDGLSDLVPMHVACLGRFFADFPTTGAIRALKELAAGTRERAVAVVAIQSLPRDAVAWYKKRGVIAQENVLRGRKELDELVDVLESYGDDVVEIYLRSKLEFVKP